MSKNDSPFDNLDTDKQERILDVAVEEFSEHGFHQASVNRMVKSLGIAKGSIFKYFGTKQGLFEYVFERAKNLFSDTLREVRDSTADKDFFTRVRLSLEAGVRFIDAHPGIYRIYLKMLFQENFPMREAFLSKARFYSAKYLRPMIEQGIERGELRSNLDVTWAVFFLDAVMDRFLQAYAVPFMDAESGLYRAEGEELSVRIDKLMDIIRHGLGAPGIGGKI